MWNQQIETHMMSWHTVQDLSASGLLFWSQTNSLHNIIMWVWQTTHDLVVRMIYNNHMISVFYHSRFLFKQKKTHHRFPYHILHIVGYFIEDTIMHYEHGKRGGMHGWYLPRYSCSAVVKYKNILKNISVICKKMSDKNDFCNTQCRE